MKKILLPFICLFVILGSAFSQERYIDEVFDDYTVTPSNLYAENLTVIAANAEPPQPYLPTGQFGIPALELDVYEPTGDTETERPLVIVLHTGTFAPIIYNGNPTGMRADYATTEMCASYARRGYVVANVEYRLGCWLVVNFKGRWGGVGCILERFPERVPRKRSQKGFPERIHGHVCWHFWHLLMVV